MKITKLIMEKIVELKAELLNKQPDFLEKYPIEFYIEDVKSYPILINYNYTHISNELVNIFKKILYTYNAHTLALYQKIVLLFLMNDAIKKLTLNVWPRSICDLYNGFFKRVFNDLSELDDIYYTQTNDSFLKDLAVCSLRSIPVSRSWMAEISGIGRRFLFTGGVRQFAEGFRFAFFKLRGFKPFYQIHVVERQLDGFNPKGRNQCYLNIAKLLKLNPKIKGMFGSSWYFDPALEEISPRLLYLRQIPEENGAKIFRISSNQLDINNAINKSPTRKKLYEEGRYVPKCYLEIWSRKNLIAWADEQ